MEIIMGNRKTSDPSYNAFTLTSSDFNTVLLDSHIMYFATYVD